MILILAEISAAGTGETSTAEKTEPPKAVESSDKSTTGIDDFFKDPPSLSTPPTVAQPQKDVKNDIMSLFEKVHAA